MRNLLLPDTIAVLRPAAWQRSKIVGTLMVLPTAASSSLSLMPCFSITQPVSMLVCDGSVMASGVVVAQNVKLPRAIMPRRLGMSARRATSGRRPSMLMRMTCGSAPGNCGAAIVRQAADNRTKTARRRLRRMGRPA